MTDDNVNIKKLQDYNKNFIDKLEKFCKKNKIDRSVNFHTLLHLWEREKDDEYKEISIKKYPYKCSLVIQYWVIDLDWFNILHNMICEYVQPFLVKFRTGHGMGKNYIEYHIYISEDIIKNPDVLLRQRKLKRITNE